MTFGALLISLCVGLVGCPGAGTGPGSTSAITLPASSPLLNALGAVEQAIENREFPRAHGLISTLRQEHPDDPYLSALDLLSARAFLGAGQLGTARAMLKSLRGGANVPPQVAEAGAWYEVLVEAKQGGVEKAVTMVTKDAAVPDTRWVAPWDAASLWVVLAEGALRRKAPDVAIQHFAAALATDRRDEALVRYAKSRAFGLAAGLSDDRLARAWGAHRDPVATAALGVVRLTRAPDAHAAEYARVEAALVQVDEPLRVAELTQMMTEGKRSGRLIVGAVLPLTGTSRRVGRTVLAGILQAQGTFSPGGGPRLTVVFKDSGSDPERAVAAVRDLHALGALAVIGPVSVKTSRAVAKEAQTLKLPMVNLSLDESLAGQDPLLFRFGSSVDAELAALLSALGPVDELRAVVLQPSSSYGRRWGTAFVSAFEAQGGTVAKTLTYDADARDFRKLAKRVAKVDAALIFVPDGVARAGLIASFLAQENIWVRPLGTTPGKRDTRRFVAMLGTSAWYDLEALGRVGRDLAGAQFPVPYAREAKHVRNLAFLETFNKLYGRLPGTYEAYAFDLTRLLRELIMTGQHQTRPALAAALREVIQYDGVLGRFDIAESGELRATPHVLRITSTGLEQVFAPPVETSTSDPVESPPAPVERPSLPAGPEEGDDEDAASLPPMELAL